VGVLLMPTNNYTETIKMLLLKFTRGNQYGTNR